MVKNVDNIVYTHSDYEDVLRVFFAQMQKYMDVFNNNYIFVNKELENIPSNYIQVLYDETGSYPQRILECFSKIKQNKIIFFQHEDMFLYEKPRLEKIEKYVKIMEHRLFFNSYDFIRLIRSGDCISIPDKEESTLHKIDRHSNWIFSIQPSLWKTKKFIELLNAHKKQNIWEFEEAAQKTVKKERIRGAYSYGGGKQRGLYHFDNDVYPYIATAIVKGKWNIHEYEDYLPAILEENNVDVNVRGVFNG